MLGRWSVSKEISVLLAVWSRTTHFLKILNLIVLQTQLIQFIMFSVLYLLNIFNALKFTDH